MKKSKWFQILKEPASETNYHKKWSKMISHSYAGRMSCRFKLTPSVNQMITFSKQPQCDEGSEQTAGFFMHSRLCFLHLNANRLNVQVQVCGTDKCSMSAFSTEQFFTMTFKLFTFFSSSCFAGENINSWPDNYLYKPVFSFTVWTGNTTVMTDNRILHHLLPVISL